MKRKSASVLFDACEFYFVKLITKYSEYTDNVFLAIEHEDGLYQSPIDSKRLFWALPGTNFLYRASKRIINHHFCCTFQNIQLSYHTMYDSVKFHSTTTLLYDLCYSTIA